MVSEMVTVTSSAEKKATALKQTKEEVQEPHPLNEREVDSLVPWPWIAVL